ncbi:MAG: tRNA(fMet)-specific endonuclease VapC [Verrucomicrobiota bacterium]|jgi:tRNA(fMet)-specific endonuclease VapC
MHLLDSDTSIRLMRYQPSFVTRLAALRASEVFISSITYHELYYGALHSGNPDRHFKLLETLTGAVTVLPFTRSSANRSAEVRESLAAKGIPIGPLDTLIAGHALEHELTLVTGNVRDFSRVEGLALENWDET